MARVVLLGGSFNPPHLGHQMLCLWALSADIADQVWFVPCYEHAFGKPLCAFDARVAMCNAAIGVFAPGRVIVCDIEKSLQGPSRTLHTIEALQKHYPQHVFSLLIGADVVPDTVNWYRFDEIQKRVRVIVAGRQGFVTPQDAMLHPEFPNINSTEIRQALATASDTSAWLPHDVRMVIDTYGLYRDV